jgi:7,8-dihydroneopterin aldolase/epimerase/oxygenase
MDYIHLRNLRAYSYMGVLPAERELGQWLSLDLSLGVDLSPAGESDRLEDTLDYRDLIRQAQIQMETAECELLEHLAEQIANLGLAYPQLQSITLTLTKLAPPIPNYSGTVAIEITRYPMVP